MARHSRILLPVRVAPKTTTFIQFATNDVIPAEFENSGYRGYLGTIATVSE